MVIFHSYVTVYQRVTITIENHHNYRKIKGIYGDLMENVPSFNGDFCGDLMVIYIMVI